MTSVKDHLKHPTIVTVSHALYMDDGKDENWGQNICCGETKKNNQNKILYLTYLDRCSLLTNLYKFWVTYSSCGRNQLCKALS